jgi:hypothetical protein
MLCTVVLALMINVDNLGWTKVVKYLRADQLDTFLNFTANPPKNIEIKDAEIFINQAAPFDCDKGPPLPKKPK